MYMAFDSEPNQHAVIVENACNVVSNGHRKLGSMSMVGNNLNECIYNIYSK